MNFNDSQLSSDKQIVNMQKDFNVVLQQELSDLEEIISKLKEQERSMTADNKNNEYTKVIENIRESIKKVENIVYGTKNITPKTNYTLSIPDELRKVTKVDTETHISPVRSKEEYDRHNTLKNAKSPHRRRNPLQKIGISALLSKFSLNKGNRPTPQTKNDANYLASKDKWIYHRIVIAECDRRKKIIHNQADIVRLLLLYMILRPTCRYMSVIANVANTQFENYVNLLNN